MTEEKKETEQQKVWNADELRGNTFEGTVISAEVVKRESKGQPQKGLRDYLSLTLATSVSDKPFSVNMAFSDRKNSLFGEFLRALKKCKVSIANEKDLVGAKFLWERTDIDFGNFSVKDFPLPVEFLGKAK